MALEKPTVLFVHGSWHQPSHFVPVRQVFEDAGYLTSCPQLPSFGTLPPTGLMEDARCIQDELRRLIDDEGKNVIVVGHSYGGVVITQAVDEVFAKRNRDNEGKKGGVVRLVYMCAFLLPINVSLAGALGGSFPPFIPVDDQGMCEMMDPAKRFYQDLPVADQQHWVSELGKCPAIAQMTPLTQTAYLYHPVTYLYCESDAAIPYDLQQRMVKNISDTTGIVVEVENCNSSHSPFLSMPGRVLEVVQKVVE